MSVNFDVIIPARYASSRFPGKLLEDIDGKSMIRRVINRAKNSSADNVIVAFDDTRIETEVKQDSDVILCPTSVDLPTGTDRVAQAALKLALPDERIVVNVQGDEPLMPASLIDKVASALSGAQQAKVATAARSLQGRQEREDPNVVKCVTDRNGCALYFSRSAIPWEDSAVSESELWLHHIGIYAYRVGYLVEHARRAQCMLEQAERLEQLRVLYNGDRIAVVVDNDYEAIGVDTPEDLEAVKRMLAQSDRPSQQDD